MYIIQIDFFKMAERIQRGVGGKYIVKGSNTKIPIKFCQFLNNRINKERLIDMIRDVWIDNSNKLSAGQQIYFSKKGEMLSHHKRTECIWWGVIFKREKRQNKDLNIKHATMTNAGPVVVRYSGNTDIPVLVMSLFSDTDQARYLLH